MRRARSVPLLKAPWQRMGRARRTGEWSWHWQTCLYSNTSLLSYFIIDIDRLASPPIRNCFHISFLTLTDLPILQYVTAFIFHSCHWQACLSSNTELLSYFILDIGRLASPPIRNCFHISFLSMSFRWVLLEPSRISIPASERSPMSCCLLCSLNIALYTCYILHTSPGCISSIVYSIAYSTFNMRIPRIRTRLSWLYI